MLPPTKEYIFRDESRIIVFMGIRNPANYDQNRILCTVPDSSGLLDRLSQVLHNKQLVQMLKDNSYNNVVEMSGKFDAWMKVGYLVVTHIVNPHG